MWKQLLTQAKKHVLHSKERQQQFCFVLLGIALFFLWYLRLFALSDAFFFQNDVGRDYLVIWEWLYEGKIPWLGPLNSAIAFNQSPFYFYLLTPFYLVFGSSVYSTTVGWLVLVTGLSVWGAYQLRRDTWLLQALTIFVLLAAMYPQLVMQTRVVWNPSFVLPLLGTAYMSVLYAVRKQRMSWYVALVCAAAVGLSIGMHLSSIVGLLPLFVMVLFLLPRDFLKVSLLSAGATLAAFGPNLLFDATHQWQITRRLLAQGVLQTTSVLHPPAVKFQQLLRMVWSDVPRNYWGVLGGVLIACLIYEVWRAYTQRNWIFLRQILVVVCCVVATVALTVFSPVQVQAHYIFAVVTSLFLLISLVRTPVVWGVILALTIFWMQPAIHARYVQPAPRSLAELQSCFAALCADYKQPLYESVVAGFHGYHYGPEFLYLMKSQGCDAQRITDLKDTARHMVVVADQTEYTHGVSDYYEIGLLGPSRVLETRQCAGNVTLTILEQE